jgi:hypothetical protein
MRNLKTAFRDEIRIREFGNCVSAVYTSGETVKPIVVKLSYSTIKTISLTNSMMQCGVTWLNKSNKLVTLNWLLRIAFHVGHSSSTCLTVSWAWHALHWGGLSFFIRWPCAKKACPIRSRWMMISSRRGSRYDLVVFTVVQLHVICSESRDSMKTATDGERAFWSVRGSQSKVKSRYWRAIVGLLSQQCHLPSFRPSRHDLGSTREERQRGDDFS